MIALDEVLPDPRAYLGERLQRFIQSEQAWHGIGVGDIGCGIDLAHLNHAKPSQTCQSHDSSKNQ
jgi:hypothetical protein